MISRQYLAGFFDGEGCVNLTYSGKSKQSVLRVFIVNTDPEILQQINIEFGGRLERPIRLQENWKAFRKLTFVNKAAFDFLCSIYPYLIVKKRQAKLGMDFWNFQHSEGRHTHGYTAQGKRAARMRKPETIARELEFKALMHELNRKGVVQ